jgi:hypothetical protein
MDNHFANLDWAMDGVKRRLGFLDRSVGALHLGQGGQAEGTAAEQQLGDRARPEGESARAGRRRRREAEEADGTRRTQGKVQGRPEGEPPHLVRRRVEEGQERRMPQQQGDDPAAPN